MNKTTPYYEVMKSRLVELYGDKDLLDNHKHVAKMRKCLDEIRLIELEEPTDDTLKNIQVS